MGDANGIMLSDLLGLSQPLTKLIETVSCGIGKVYEPTHVKRIAKAKAKEIELISGALSDTINLPTSYENGAISIDTKNANDLVMRAQNRFLFQQMKKQQNIESVVANAYSELVDKESVSDESVESDWVSSFFDFIANISDERMQLLWGKLLAGEIERPGSFSIRTLDVLRKLTQKEAAVFQEIVPYTLRCWIDENKTIEDIFLLHGDFLEKYGISFSKIIALHEAGLISENTNINIGLEINQGEAEHIWNINRSLGIEIKNTGDAFVHAVHPSYMLTEAGKELSTIVLDFEHLLALDAYMQDCLEEMKENGINISGTPSKLSKVTISLIRT